MSEFVGDDGLSRIATMLNGHGEEAWFDLPFDQEIEVKGLTTFVKTELPKWGGVIG